MAKTKTFKLKRSFANNKLILRRGGGLIFKQSLHRLILESFAVLLLLSVLALTGYQLLNRPDYHLTPQASLLAGIADKQVLKQVSYNRQSGIYFVNKAGINAGATTPMKSINVGSKSNDSGSYSAQLPQSLNDGVTVYDDTSNISFTMAAKFSTSSLKNLGKHFIYPASNGSQVVYTLKSDGVKEDVILNKPVGNTLQLAYALKLPDYLQARMEKSGAVGVYSANPALFGNISYGSASDRSKVAAARLNGPKNHLVFELLPPVINESNGRLNGKATAATAKFSLSGNTLTVTATHLAKLHYPIAIDPSILVTSAFNQKGNNDGGVSVTGSQVSEAGLSGGDTSSWNYTCNSANNGTNYSCGFVTGREFAASVAYDGYLYVLGGHYTTNGSTGWSSAGTYNWTVPAGVNSVNVDMYGAIGGNGAADAYGGGTGGNGGRVTGTINVTPGETLTAIIGGNGSVGTYTGTSYTPGGYNNPSGGGGFSTNGSNGAGGGSGGGCTTLENGGTILALAPGGGGGGGGGTGSGTGGNGGYGGGTTGATGSNGVPSVYGTGGAGGSSSAGGGGGNSGGNAGVSLSGGAGSGGGNGGAGGGGGCGYYGGGGGGAAGNDGVHGGGGGGGGGSAYVPSGGTAQANASTSNGSMSITYTQNFYLNDVQYAPINSNGTVGSWTSTTSFATPRYGANALVYNGYMYILGGNGNGLLNDVQYAKINSNGSLGGWTATSSFNNARYAFQAVSNNGYLYILGGNDGSLLNDVQFAPILSDGSLGTWQYTYNSAASGSFVGGFSTAREFMGAAVYNNILYVAGGYTGGAASDVQYAKINSNGTVSNWYSTTGFATPRWSFSMTVFNGYLYIAGGYSGSAPLSDVQYAPIYGTGIIGPWSTSGAQLNIARWGTGFTPYKGYLYVLGGNANGANTQDCTTNSTMCNGVQYAQIDQAGGISGWQNNSNGLVTAVRQSCVVAYGGYIYALGGFSDTAGTSQASVQYAALNSDGSVGTWSTTSSFSYGRHALGCAAYNGYIYITGGTEFTASDTNCKNTGVASNLCNDTQYAPINTNGTLGAWTTSTNYFTTPRRSLGTVVYNGYIYIFGGLDWNTNPYTFYNDVQYAAINPNGSIGPWNTTSSFKVARSAMGVYTYDGYVYLVGGSSGTSAGDCTTGSGTYYCNGVQFAKFNSNGSLGSWNYTHNSTNDGGTYVAGFGSARSLFAGGASNGYLYIAGGTNTSTLNSAQYAMINPDGTIGAWANTSSMSTATNEQPTSTTLFNGTLYTVGGSQGGSAITTVTYAHINNGGPGLINGWNGTSAFNTARAYQASLIYNDYIYIIGGQAGTSAGDCTTGSGPYYCNGVQYASIDPTTGVVGTWNYTHNSTNDGSSFVAGFNNPRANLQAIAYHGYLYLLGGNDNTQNYNDVQYAKINSDGTLGAWSVTSSFLTARTGFAADISNGYLYVLGGQSATSSGDCSAGTGPYFCSGVEFAAINTDGTVGPWHYTSNSADNGTTFSSGFTGPRSGMASVVYNGYIYIIAGQSSVTAADCPFSASGMYYCNGVQYAPINNNGTIGSWNYTIPLPDGHAGPTSALTYDGNLYVVAGYQWNGSSVTYGSDSSYASIGKTGYLGSWSSMTNYPANVSGLSLGIADGRLFGLGGSAGGSTYYANVYRGAVFSTPRIGRYTLELDLTNAANLDVTPANIMLNGSAWTGTGSTSAGQGGINVLYEFADDSCKTWSLPGTSNMPLGTYNKVSYTKNGCAMNTSQARYIWLQLVLDDSQTATYPDSSGGHSTVTGISVNYHTNSGYRLRGGATFMNQNLQSLDTSP